MSDLDLMRRAIELIEQAMDALDDVATWPGGDSPINDLIASEDKVQNALALRESRLLSEGALDTV